jgi:hypothetical protein
MLAPRHVYYIEFRSFGAGKMSPELEWSDVPPGGQGINSHLNRLHRGQSMMKYHGVHAANCEVQ